MGVLFLVVGGVVAVIVVKVREFLPNYTLYILLYYPELNQVLCKRIKLVCTNDVWVKSGSHSVTHYHLQSSSYKDI